MRQTVKNCTELPEKSTQTRNVIAAISAAGRWTPPAWCDESTTTEKRETGESGMFPGVAVHRVFVTDHTWQKLPEKSSGTLDSEYQKISFREMPLTGMSLHQNKTNEE